MTLPGLFFLPFLVSKENLLVSKENLRSGVGERGGEVELLIVLFISILTLKAETVEFLLLARKGSDLHFLSAINCNNQVRVTSELTLADTCITEVMPEQLW